MAKLAFSSRIFLCQTQTCSNENNISDACGKKFPMLGGRRKIKTTQELVIKYSDN